MTKKVVCIAADPDTRIDSFSSSVTRAFLDELRASEADCEITEMSLYDLNLPYLNVEWIEKMEAAEKEKRKLPGQSQSDEIENFNELLNQLTHADAIIFVSRTIGFGLPAQLKSLIEVLAATKQLDKLNNKKGFHLQIEDDMFAPVFPRDGEDSFRIFLLEYSLHMMETLTLNHQHSNVREQENFLLEMIEETREMAREFASFIDQR